MVVNKGAVVTIYFDLFGKSLHVEYGRVCYCLARRIELVYTHTYIGNLIVKQQVLGVSSGSQR